tara:strand:- start:2299 stop:2529 length:231 start_codon:yes stop_codon:yes gene_type:complete
LIDGGGEKQLKSGKGAKKMQKKLSEMNRVEKIKYWKDKYRNSPNGYWVSMIIGSEYINDMAMLSKQQRERYKKKKK